MVLLLRGSLATRRMQQQRRYEKGGQKRVAHWMPSQPSGSNRGSRRVIVHGGAGGAGGDAAHSNNSSRDRPNSAPPNGTCIHNGAYVHHQHQHHQHHNHHQQQQQQQQHQQQQQQPADASAQPHKPANVPQHQPSFPQAGPPAPGGEGNHIETRLGIVKKNRRSNSAALAGLSCDLTLDDSADSKKKIVAYIVNQKQQPQQFLEQNPTPAVANPAEKGRAASPKQKNQDSNTHLGLDFDVQLFDVDDRQHAGGAKDDKDENRSANASLPFIGAPCTKDELLGDVYSDHSFSKLDSLIALLVGEVVEATPAASIVPLTPLSSTLSAFGPLSAGVAENS